MQRQDFLGFIWNQGYPINHTYHVEIIQRVVNSTVEIGLAYRDLTTSSGLIPLGSVIDDGTRDSGPAYPVGKVGLYAEDACVRFYAVSIG